MEEGDDFAAMFAKPSRRPKGRARRVSESKPVSHAMRREMRSGEIKDVQLNTKVTATFKAQVTRLCTAHRVSIPVLLEMAVEALVASEGK